MNIRQVTVYFFAILASLVAVLLVKLWSGSNARQSDDQTQHVHGAPSPLAAEPLNSRQADANGITTNDRRELESPPSLETATVNHSCTRPVTTGRYDNWQGSKGLARKKNDWPYVHYDDSLLTQLSDQGDAEASFQLAMNFRWRYLYEDGGEHWDPAIDVSQLTQSSHIDTELSAGVSTYLLRAADQGYAYAYVELADFTMEILPNQIQLMMALPKEQRSGIDETTLISMSQAMAAAFSSLPDKLYFDSDQAFTEALESFASDDNGKLLRQAYRGQLNAIEERRLGQSLPPYSEAVPRDILEFHRICLN